MAHNEEVWLHRPFHLGGPQHFRLGDKIRSGPNIGGLAIPRLRCGGSQQSRAQDVIGSGPHVGQLATSPQPYGDLGTLQSRGQNHKLPMWVDWLHHPCRRGLPQCFNSGDQIKSGPQLGGLATSPLPSGASPSLHIGGPNQNGPTIGQIGYITLAMWGVPHSPQWRTKSQLATYGWIGYFTPAVTRVPNG